MKPMVRRGRMLVMLVTMCGALGVAACGSDEKQDAPPKDADRAAAVVSDPGSVEQPLSRPFDPNAPAGEAPDLPKVVAHSMPSNAAIFLKLEDGLKAAADDRGLEAISANADGDPAKQVEQLEGFLQRGVGAIVVTPVDARAIEDVLRRAEDQGIAVFGLNAIPATNFGGANQYEIGLQAGLDAAKFIREKLGGNAQVAILHVDSYPPLIPRHRGWKEGVLTAGSGVRIVSEIEPEKITPEAGANAMNTALQAHPDINVVLTLDWAALGAIPALEAAGKDPATTYVAGNDGDAPNIAELKKPNSLFKADYGFNNQTVGYAWGQQAADWLEGKSIPQATDFRAVPLTSAAEIDAFQAAGDDPAKAYEESRDTYVKFYGNISYETKDNVIDYFWDPGNATK